MSRMLRQAFRLLLFVGSAATAWPQVVVIESRSGGDNFRCYRETSGHWWNSVAKSSATGCTANIGSRFLEAELDGTAEFVPELPSEGRYEVFATWGKAGNAKRVKYSILSGTVQDIRFLDQDGWGGAAPPNHSQWHSLGFHVLSPEVAKVIISGDKVTGAPEPRYPLRVYADAIRFVPVGYAQEGVPSENGQPGIPSVQPPNDREGPSLRQDEPTAIPTPAAAPEDVDSRDLAWREDLVSAIGEAKGLGRPVLIYFFSSPAEGCQRMDAETWTDESVLEAMAGAILVRIDVLHHVEQAAKFRIFRVPALVILNARGEPVEREMQEFFTPEEVVELLRGTVEEN